MKSQLLLLASISMLSVADKRTDYISYPNWQLHFPEGSGMGLFLAFAIPLSAPYNNVYFATNYEATYRLPSNETKDWDYPPLLEKRIDRKLVYNAIKMNFRTHGYPGKDCLLRTICEAAVHKIASENGVLGDIIHIILTPSTSHNEGISNDYQRAETYGTSKQNCKKYHEKCSISFLDLISWIGHAI